MTGKVKPEDSFVPANSTTQGLPLEIIEHLLQRGAEGRVHFSSASVGRVTSLFQKVLCKLVVDITEDKRLSNQIKNALLAIEPLQNQRFLTLTDAIKTLNKIPLFHQITPPLSSVPVKPKVEGPYLFSASGGVLPLHLTPAAALPTAHIPVTLLGATPQSATPSSGATPEVSSDSFNMETFEPKRRGRGRPPLKARTDAGFPRGGPGPVGPASFGSPFPGKF